MLPDYRRPAVFSPEAEPSLSHFACSFQGRAVSRTAPESPMIGAGSFVAQEASMIAMQQRSAIRMSFTHVGSGIRASINDSISGLHLDTVRQAAGNDIADSGRRFN